MTGWGRTAQDVIGPSPSISHTGWYPGGPPLQRRVSLALTRPKEIETMTEQKTPKQVEQAIIRKIVIKKLAIQVVIDAEKTKAQAKT